MRRLLQVSDPLFWLHGSMEIHTVSFVVFALYYAQNLKPEKLFELFIEQFETFDIPLVYYIYKFSSIGTYFGHS